MSPPLSYCLPRPSGWRIPPPCLTPVAPPRLPGVCWRGGYQSGITLNTATGRLSGTPTALGTYSLRYEVTNATGVRASRVAHLSVQTAPPTVLAAPAVRQAALRAATPAESGKTHAPAVEVFLAGSSAQQHTLEALIRSMFIPDTVEVFYDDGGSPGTLAGHDYRAWGGIVHETGTAAGHDYRAWGGIVHETGTALDGQAVRIHYRARGGSVYGVHPVALALPIERMVVDAVCTVVAERQWSCPAGRTVLAIPDAGVSDVEPTLFVGVNLPTDATLPAALHRPLTLQELASLEIVRPYAAVVGIAVTDTLPLKTLRTMQVVQVLRGQSQGGFRSVPTVGYPLILCRRVAGAGIEAAANAYFLGNPCIQESVGPVSATDGAADGVTVREVASTEALVACLSEAFARGEQALGMLPVAYAPTPEAGWHFIALDDASPTVRNAAMGRYGWIVEPALLWRATTVNGVVAPTDEQRLFLDMLAQRAGDPAVLGALPGVAALPTSGVAPPARFHPASPVMGVSLFGDTCLLPSPVPAP